MGATITYDEVVALIGVDILTLNLHPNFEQIRILRCHFEHALQRLPCPQTTLHRWKGMVMARELCPPYTNTFLSTNQTRQRSRLPPPGCCRTACQHLSVDKNGTGINRHKICARKTLLPVNV
jgi:hypothetical protein